MVPKGVKNTVNRRNSQRAFDPAHFSIGMCSIVLFFEPSEIPEMILFNINVHIYILGLLMHLCILENWKWPIPSRMPDRGVNKGVFGFSSPRAVDPAPWLSVLHSDLRFCGFPLENFAPAALDFHFNFARSKLTYADPQTQIDLCRPFGRCISAEVPA